MKKKALITGITGQDGSFLVELLLENGYEVHGIIRRASTFNTLRIDHLMNDETIMNKNLFIHYGDITDAANINQLVRTIQPDELYNLAAQSQVRVSFEIPVYTGMVDGLGALTILEAVRQLSPHTKLYQASTSEMFGGMEFNMPEKGYNENSLFYPRSPYGCAKLYAYWITKNYREAYNLFAASAFIFNHESARRGETFISRKVTLWFASYMKSKINKQPFTPLKVGNLTALRDWSHAKDIVKSMYMILQHDKPEDFVVSSGEMHSVREFIEICFSLVGKTIEWSGEGLNEIGICDGEPVVKVDPRHFRPTEVQRLLGDCTKIKETLGWTPEYSFMDLVTDMVTSDFTLKGVNII